MLVSTGPCCRPRLQMRQVGQVVQVPLRQQRTLRLRVAAHATWEMDASRRTNWMSGHVSRRCMPPCTTCPRCTLPPAGLSHQRRYHWLLHWLLRGRTAGLGKPTGGVPKSFSSFSCAPFACSAFDSRLVTEGTCQTATRSQIREALPPRVCPHGPRVCCCDVLAALGRVVCAPERSRSSAGPPRAMAR